MPATTGGSLPGEPPARTILELPAGLDWGTLIQATDMIVKWWEDGNEIESILATRLYKLFHGIQE